MPDTQENLPHYPVLVVAYDENNLAALVASLKSFEVPEVACSNFMEAEKHALSGLYKGLLVDLATIIKAKAEEKIIAYTLTRIYPALRVKTMGAMLIPMAMAGDAKQDKSLNDFIVKTCAGFTPRTLRSGKRRDVCIPTCIGGERGFTLNISWSGLFVADMNPERFSVGQEISLFFPDFDIEVEVIVARVQVWGERRPPGIGAKFRQMDEELENRLFSLLKSDKSKDRDRLIA